MAEMPSAAWVESKPGPDHPLPSPLDCFAFFCIRLCGVCALRQGTVFLPRRRGHRLAGAAWIIGVFGGANQVSTLCGKRTPAPSILAATTTCEDEENGMFKESSWYF